jgi:hypothetical protein
MLSPHFLSLRQSGLPPLVKTGWLEFLLGLGRGDVRTEGGRSPTGVRTSRAKHGEGHVPNGRVRPVVVDPTAVDRQFHLRVGEVVEDLHIGSMMPTTRRGSSKHGGRSTTKDALIPALAVSLLGRVCSRGSRAVFGCASSRRLCLHPGSGGLSLKPGDSIFT